MHVVKMRGDEAVKYVADHLPEWGVRPPDGTAEELVTLLSIAEIAAVQLHHVILRFRELVHERGYEADEGEFTIKPVPAEVYAEMLAKKRACDG